MVNFGQQLEAEMVKEWREYYLDYKGLNKIINKIGSVGHGHTRFSTVASVISRALDPLPQVGSTASTSDISNSSRASFGKNYQKLNKGPRVSGLEKQKEQVYIYMCVCVFKILS